MKQPAVEQPAVEHERVVERHHECITTKARRNRERVQRTRHAEWEATKDENGCYGATPPSARKKAEKRTEQRMVSKQRERDGQALEEARLQELEEALENERVKWEKQEADQQQRERDDQALDEAGLQEVEQMYTQALEAAAKIRETCARELEEAEAQALPEEKQKEKQKTHTKVLPLVPIFRPEPTAAHEEGEDDPGTMQGLQEMSNSSVNTDRNVCNFPTRKGVAG